MIEKGRERQRQRGKKRDAKALCDKVLLNAIKS